jgi:hypothetical protein
MFGNLIKLVLFAVIIASVALFARDRMNPPETAPETVSSASDDAASNEEAAPDSTPPESVDPPQPAVSQTASAPMGTGTTAVSETETGAGAPQPAPPSGAGTPPKPPEPAVATEASPPPTAAEIGPAAGMDGPMSSVPDTAPLSEQATEVMETQANDAAATLPVPAETEPAAPGEMAPLPPVHPGPDDTSLPSDPAPPQSPLTQ